jgi:hypothetical protein
MVPLEPSYMPNHVMCVPHRSLLRFLMSVDFSCDCPNPFSRTMVLGLTGMSTKNRPGGKGRSVREADNFTANCNPISRQCGILNISQPYRPPWSVTGIALLYIGDVLTSQQTLLWASKSCYGDSSTSYTNSRVYTT